MKKLTLVFSSLLFLISGNLLAQDLTVETIDVGTAVEDRQLIGSDSTFTSTIETLYCFTKVTGAQDTTEIFHIWYYDGEEKARTPLSIRSSSFRTWSSKRILESWTGPWRVAIEDLDGNVLAEKSFTISEN